jgi:LuxR family maltose regulon positive regulatory protein
VVNIEGKGFTRALQPILHRDASMKNEVKHKTFLGNKFCAPTSETFTVCRQNLYDKLSEKKSKQWSSISAPAGFGKTSLVLNWLATQTFTPVWLTLESSDNQISDFWVAVVTAYAVQGFETTTHKALKASFSGDVGSDEWTSQFFKELCSLAQENKQNPILVLDDMHHINSQAVISSIVRLLRFLPSELRVVLISREIMPKAIKSLNISSASVELTAQELSFTNDQCLAYAKSSIRHYADKVNDPHLNASLKEKVGCIYQQTDGWPVFVCFAIHCLLEGGVDTIDANNLIDQDDIRRYLEHHIYDNMSQGFKQSLIGLVPFSAVNKAFYQDCLNLPVEFDKLVKVNGLLISKNVVSGFMRLREPLKQFLTPLWLEENQGKKTQEFEITYQWYLGRKMFIEAILLSLTRSHWLVAIDLIEKESEYLLTSGRCSEICAPFDLIPEAFIIDRPVLLIFMARYFHHQVTHIKVTRYVNQAKSSISDDKSNDFSVGKYTHRSKAQLLTDMSQLKHWVGGLLNESSSGYNAPEVEVRPQCSDDKITAGLMCGLYYLSIGKIPKAQGLLESSLKKGLIGGHHAVLSKSLVALGWVCYLSGEYTRLHIILGSVKKTVTSPGSAIYTVAHQSNWIMALTLLEQGKIAQAESLLQESSFHKNTKNSPSDIKFESLIMQAITSIELNHYEEAEKIFENLDILSFELPSAVQQCFFSIPGLKAEMHLRQGSLEKATFWLERLVCPDDAQNTIIHQHECLVKADVLIALGHFDEALHHLAFLKKTAQKSGNQMILMNAYISESIAHQSRQNEDKSLASFHNAIKLGKQMGSVKSFLRNNVQVNYLLKRAKVAFHYPAYIGGLLSALNLEECSAHPDGGLLASLSKREREVLELMAGGLSNPQIAKSLCRSLGTIKIHVHNIFKKLRVSNRVTALNKYFSVLTGLNDSSESKNSMQFESIH